MKNRIEYIEATIFEPNGNYVDEIIYFDQHSELDNVPLDYLFVHTENSQEIGNQFITDVKELAKFIVFIAMYKTNEEYARDPEIKYYCMDTPVLTFQSTDQGGALMKGHRFLIDGWKIDVAKSYCKMLAAPANSSIKNKLRIYCTY